MIQVAGALCFVVWLFGFWLLWRIRVCADGLGPGVTRDEDSTRLSVIIPARNEERRLPALLASLSRQTRPADEIIVVDDHSTDGTASLAGAAGATVISAPPLPAGWTGKTWACWNGAQAASGTVIAFLDADTWLESSGLAKLFAEHRRSGGLVSVQPYHITVHPYERLSAIFNITLMMAMNIFTPLGRRLRPDGAFGPCMVMSRSDYFATGGHRSVRGAILEDFFLGRLFDESGLPVNCLAGRGTITFRMYPEGFGQMVDGWSKCFGSGSIGTSKTTLVMITGWVAGSIATMLGVFGAPWLVGAVGAVGLLPVLLYVAYSLQIHWMLRRLGHFGGWTAGLFPGPLLFLFCIFFRSLVLMLFVGRVRWKGREISTCAFRDARSEDSASVAPRG